MPILTEDGIGLRDELGRLLYAESETEPSGVIASCGCNDWSVTASGGVSCGGSASVALVQLGGGVAVGGQANAEIADRAWDGMEAVYPLFEAGDGTEDEYQDVSGNELHGTGGNGFSDNVPTLDDGVFCLSSQHGDGTQFIACPADRLRTTQAFSVSCWTRREAFYKQTAFFSRGVVFFFGHNVLGSPYATVQVLEDDGETEATVAVWGTAPLSLSRWYHVAAVIVPGQYAALFVDGVEVGRTEFSQTELVAPEAGNLIGSYDQGAFFVGNLMDVRLHPVERGAGYWLAEKAAYCDSEFVMEEPPEYEYGVAVG